MTKNKNRMTCTKTVPSFQVPVPFLGYPYGLFSLMLLVEVIVMLSQSRCFPYEKSFVINALYDTIEELGLCLDDANSIRGTLTISDAERLRKMRIALICGANTNQTYIEFFSEDSNVNTAVMWDILILDELTRRMRQVYQDRRGEIAK